MPWGCGAGGEHDDQTRTQIVQPRFAERQRLVLGTMIRPDLRRGLCFASMGSINLLGEIRGIRRRRRAIFQTRPDIDNPDPPRMHRLAKRAMLYSRMRHGLRFACLGCDGANIMPKSLASSQRYFVEITTDPNPIGLCIRAAMSAEVPLWPLVPIKWCRIVYAGVYGGWPTWLHRVPHDEPSVSLPVAHCSDDQVLRLS